MPQFAIYFYIKWRKLWLNNENEKHYIKPRRCRLSMSSTRHKIMIGDSRQMREIADNSVQLALTSPPYWQLKDYGGAQIGFNDSYEDYINNLSLVWSECRRVLENGCRLCVNIGDQFARAVYYGRYKVIPIKTEIIKCCETLGLDYMGTIIWQKTTTTNTTGGGAVMGSYPYPRNGIVKIDYESILLFRKTGAPSRRIIAQDIKNKSKMTAEEWNTYFSGHWNFCGVKQDKHPAMFPPELPNRLIKMFSFVGDTILDPFLGSGTTSLSAANLGRNSIGYEINGDYEKVMRERLRATDNLLTAPTVKFLHIKTPLAKSALQKRINALPYQFKDHVLMERKIDPKKFQFGSKIDGNGGGQRREEFYHVKKVINSDKLVLCNGATIRLLGIKPLKNKTADAAAFIRRQTDGKKVFIKFDRDKHDKAGNLLCYLYLSNKTFINAHLIKAGLATADKNTTHRHLGRFIQYQENYNG